MFNVFYQAGILCGPVAGLALAAFSFRSTCAVAAAVFAALAIAQLLVLPTDGYIAKDGGRPILAQWRSVMCNRAFVLFAVAMIGFYVLTFQFYLALPLQAGILTDTRQSETALVTVMFVISAAITILGQVHLTRWLSRRFGAGRSLIAGMGLTAGAFLLPMMSPTETPTAIVALLGSAALLAIGTIAIYPFEMDIIVGLSGNRLVATHFGLYNTIVGVGILAGNLATGAIFGYAHQHHLPELLWGLLAVLGLACTVALAALHRTGLLNSASAQA